MDKSLAVEAVNLPENSGDGQPAGKTASEPETAQALQEEIQRLRKAPEAEVTENMGDIVVRVSEVDGGLALDLVAKLPRGGGGRHTSELLELITRAASLGLSWTGSDLPHELDEAVFNDEGDRLTGSLILSTASMMNGVDALLERNERIRELRRRLAELQARNGPQTR